MGSHPPAPISGSSDTFRLKWYGFCNKLTVEKSAEPTPFDCERIVDSGLGWLISMEK